MRALAGWRSWRWPPQAAPRCCWSGRWRGLLIADDVRAAKQVERCAIRLVSISSLIDLCYGGLQAAGRIATWASRSRCHEVIDHRSDRNAWRHLLCGRLASRDKNHGAAIAWRQELGDISAPASRRSPWRDH